VSGADLDPTSRLIIEEARRRGITVEIQAPRAEYFRLRHGERAISCRESLSDLTSAVALSRCDDKRVTARVLRAAGLDTPAQIDVGDAARELAFLRTHGALVVKPARGEQGRGVSVGIRTPEALTAAIEHAARSGAPVLLEQLVSGEDLRVVVIGGELAAAALRRPPRIRGDGEHSVRELIAAESQRRAAATAGESKIPLDEEARRCVREAGFELSDVLPRGRELQVRGTANLHTGGTIHDVTAHLHPALCEVALRAARALEMPVVGLDLIVPSIEAQTCWILEANERPGLANHEPQPLAARFVDLLFPGSEPAFRPHRHS
jgi:GNAT-family acetyltransferase (TIGR03103 family)